MEIRVQTVLPGGTESLAIYRGMILGKEEVKTIVKSLFCMESCRPSFAGDTCMRAELC